MRTRRPCAIVIGGWLLLLACLAVHAEEAQPHITEQLPAVQRAISEADLADVLRDNLEQDLLPWLPSARPQGALTALDFLNLLHEIDTQWPAYRRNFIAVVVIRNNRYSFWAYPTARSWCTRRVRIAGEEFTKYVQSHNLTFPDVMYVMNGYDKPLCAAGNCSAPMFSFGKCWQPAMPQAPCTSPLDTSPPGGTSPGKKRTGGRRPGGEAPSLSDSLTTTHTAVKPTAGRSLQGYAAQSINAATRTTPHQSAQSISDSLTAMSGSPTAMSGSPAAMSDRPTAMSDRPTVMSDRPTAMSDSPAAMSDRPTAMSDSPTTAGPSQGMRSLHAAAANTPPVHFNQPRKSPYDDILFPVMNHPFDQLISYPWAQQQSQKAFMRAGLYAAMAANCSRVLLYQLAQTEEGREVLDVGIYQNRHYRVKVKTVPPVPIESHAQHRFLINTDGQAASWRLAKLLAMRSVTLKWRSPHIEHYYRSLRPGVHYVDVDQSDVLGKVREMRQEEQKLRDVAAEAQRFAYRYLSQVSRAAYARSALARYTSLFRPGDMELLLSTVPDDDGQGKPDMLELLKLRQKLMQSS